MEKLKEAYEAIEILRELDLPVSKEQIENIERLEKGKAEIQREDLKNYFFEKCYASYTKRISKIRQAIIRGEVIVAKPVLILAIIEGIELNIFIENKFPLTEWLEKNYMKMMQKYMKNSQFDKPTDITNPFWHLQSDGFWHLLYKEKKQENKVPSKRWLKENVNYAYFDADLWMLLQNDRWRITLRNYIIEEKLKDNKTNNHTVAKSLGILTALFLVA